MSDIEALRKSLSVSSEDLASEDKKKMAVEAITKILDALGRGVAPFGEWAQRCLGAAIIALRSSKFDEARSFARRAIWPEENRRNSGVARFPLRPGMLSLAELAHELETARKLPPRGKPRTVE